jgi:hypothetical protein
MNLDLLCLLLKLYLATQSACISIPLQLAVKHARVCTYCPIWFYGMDNESGNSVFWNPKWQYGLLFKCWSREAICIGLRIITRDEQVWGYNTPVTRCKWSIELNLSHFECSLSVKGMSWHLSFETVLTCQSCVINTFRPNGVYILRGLSSHQSGAL